MPGTVSSVGSSRHQTRGLRHLELIEIDVRRSLLFVKVGVEGTSSPCDLHDRKGTNSWLAASLWTSQAQRLALMVVRATRASVRCLLDLLRCNETFHYTTARLPLSSLPLTQKPTT